MFLLEKEAPWIYKKRKTDGHMQEIDVRISNVSRRGFLKSSVLAVGATFVIGVSTGCRQKIESYTDEHVPASGVMAESSFQPNILIAINIAGDVFIVCTRSEMGQGIRTGMPVVIADELGADWNRVQVEQAEGHPKYGNQNTDGSRSVRNHFDDWRKAAATAREMLVLAAAQLWNVEVSECKVDVHKVIHSPSGRELGFGELAAIASNIETPENPTLKSRDEWRYIGRSIRGHDNRAITTGKAKYGADIRIDGMLFASIERCPVIGGRARSYSSEAALNVPGVRAVIELPAAPFPPAFNALGGLAVVADNTWATFKGREALVIDWDRGPNVEYNSSSYRELLRESVTTRGQQVRASGDVPAALAQASQTVEATYFVPMLAHAPMEPPAAVAWVKDDVACEIWAPTQDPQTARNEVAQALGIDVEEVTVHVTFLGGAFGRKSKPDFVVEAALVSREAGAPILLTWSREDCMQFDYYHAPSMQYLQAGLDENGKALSWTHRTAFPPIGGTFSPADYPSDGELGLGFTTVPYNIPNMQFEKGRAPLHVRIGWLRSVSNIHHAFAVNAFAGEMAYAAGRDQRDYLLELIGPDRNLNSIFSGNTGAYGEDLTRHPYETSRLRRVIELVSEKADWGKALPEGHALGIAAHFSFVSYAAHVVHASVIDGKLQIHRVDCAFDCGTYVNADRVRSQMEGSIVFGLTLALYGEITVQNGAVKQSNFHDYRLLSIGETPETHVHLVENDAPPGGVGEPGTPSVAPALANAILQITGRPVHTLPIRLS